MPTTGAARPRPPIEPAKRASKAKTPPSAPTSQYPPVAASDGSRDHRGTQCGAAHRPGEAARRRRRRPRRPGEHVVALGGFAGGHVGCPTREGDGCDPEAAEIPGGVGVGTRRARPRRGTPSTSCPPASWTSDSPPGPRRGRVGVEDGGTVGLRAGPEGAGAVGVAHAVAGAVPVSAGIEQDVGPRRVDHGGVLDGGLPGLVLGRGSTAAPTPVTAVG